MDFEEKLTLPNLEVLNQRVAARCYLDPFSNEETNRYIVGQTDLLRIDQPHNTPPFLFTEEAKRRIYQLTDGVPRLINQLCGTSLQFAADREIKNIDGSLVNDAWLSLHHLESDSAPALTDSSPAQESVIPSEQIEEIIARKLKTFRLQQFDSVEFGMLPDSETVETEMSGTVRSFHVNEYKPPYPEDDDESAELEEAEPKVHQLPSVPVIVPQRHFVPGNVDQQHRKFRRQHLLQKIRHRLGLFASVLQKTESPQSSPSFNESGMNEKSLQEYGAAVLDGRPPFVRKEPHYAYQATPMTSPNDVAYPDPKTGVPITLRWFPEKTGDNGRFGVSYTEFLNRDHVLPLTPVKAEKTDIPLAPNVTPKPVEPAAALIVRTSLNASHEEQAGLPHHSGLEEFFEESRQVGGSTVSLAELFRIDSQRIEKSAEFQSLDTAVQRQLEAVIRRITKAAEKIEQAAEVSGRAGQHISEAAEFVETEVRAVVPTYTDLFRQWSEFQEKITAEWESAQRRNAEPPQLRTFPRRQVMIERTVPTIEVDSLLR